jgi:hypothetical protein
VCLFLLFKKKRGNNLHNKQQKQFRFSSVLYYFIGPPRLCNNQKICDDVQTQNQKKKRNKQMRTHEVKRERTQGRTHIQQASTCAGLIFNKKTATKQLCRCVFLTGIFLSPRNGDIMNWWCTALWLTLSLLSISLSLSLSFLNQNYLPCFFLFHPCTYLTIFLTVGRRQNHFELITQKVTKSCLVEAREVRAFLMSIFCHVVLYNRVT